MLPTAKSILMFSGEDAGWSSQEPLYVSRYDLWPFCCQCHFHCLLGEQSTAGSRVSIRKMSKEVWASAQWTPLSGACILRGTKGINSIAVCFAMLWAAFQCISKGSIRNVLSRLSDGKQYSQWAIGSCSFLSVGIAREGVEGDFVTFKFHTGEMLPSGLRDRCSLGAISCDSGAV